jgi:ABC-type transport system involved in multi-copper enzyme maturation permease subunit
MSFAAIVLVYDSISGERERGTLRLNMSNPVPRSTVILGKYLGTMIMLIIPLLIGMLFSMIIVAISGKVSLGGSDWVRILVIILLSLLYLSIFVLLGLFLSSLLRSSAASLVLLLLAWTVIVVVIPSVTGVITTHLSELPSIGWKARDARDKADQEYDASHPEAEDLLAGYWVTRGNLGKHLYRNDAYMAVYKDYWDKMVLGVRLGRNVARISPCVVYRCATESIAGSGIDHHESFMKQIWQYRTSLRNFLVDHYPLDLHRRYEGDEELERHAFRACAGVKFTGADVPKFHDDPIPAGDAMRNSLWDIAILFILNFVFFMAAYMSFLRRDVR